MKKQWTLMDRYRDVQQRTGQSPILQAAAYERASKAQDGQMEFILSMPGIKRDGFDIQQDGWLLEDYRENNVVLWRHSDANPSDIMGNCSKVWRSTAGGKPLHLRGLLRWATLEQNPQIGPIRAMYEDYVLRATSVRWEDDGLDSLQEISQEELKAAKTDPMVALYLGGIRFLRARLIEWSLVPLGMDKQALSVRCQRGEISPDRFVATIKDDQLITDDGREVLVLDGHPARFETERNLTVDLGASSTTDETRSASADVAHTDTYEIAPAQVGWTQYADAPAYLHDCQRFLRGTLDGEGLEAHLADEAKRLGQLQPVHGLMGTYRGLHEDLAEAVALENQEAIETLRAVIVPVAQRLFGEARLRESWEPRVLPEPKLVWASVSSLLEVGLREVVANGEERDAHIDTLIAGLDAAIGNKLRWAEEANALFGQLGRAVSDDCLKGTPAEIAEQIMARLNVQPDATPEIAAEAETQRAIEPVEADPLESLANHLETKVGRKATDKTTLLMSLLAGLPAS